MDGREWPDFCPQEAPEWQEKVPSQEASLSLSLSGISPKPGTPAKEEGAFCFPRRSQTQSGAPLGTAPLPRVGGGFQARSEGAKAGRMAPASRQTSAALLGRFGSPFARLRRRISPAREEGSLRNRAASLLQQRRRFSWQAQAPSAKEQAAAEPTAEATPPLPGSFLGLSHALLRYWRAWERKAGTAAQIPPFPPPLSAPWRTNPLWALGRQHPDRKDPQLTWGHSCFFPPRSC